MMQLCTTQLLSVDWTFWQVLQAMNCGVHGFVFDGQSSDCGGNIISGSTVDTVFPFHVADSAVLSTNMAIGCIMGIKCCSDSNRCNTQAE